MSKRILLCLSHSIEEYDQLRLLSGLGYEVASIGGYINPGAPHDPKRPALPEVPHYPEVQAAVDALGVADNLGAAQAHIPAAIFDWLGDDGIIIYHHYLSRLYGQWGDPRFVAWRKAGGRVIWRTVGQSTTTNEEEAVPYRADGMEIIRYSPHEQCIPGFAGADGLIRFYKDEDEWLGWEGNFPIVTNITQEMLRRSAWTNAQFYLDATEGLHAQPGGPGSEQLPGGVGALSLAAMKSLLRRSRCYLYTGTQPASYTLGLIEALMTGIPVLSIGPAHMTHFPYSPQLFEGYRFASAFSDDPADAAATLRGWLEDRDLAEEASIESRGVALRLFSKGTVGAAWKQYLG